MGDETEAKKASELQCSRGHTNKQTKREHHPTKWVVKRRLRRYKGEQILLREQWLMWLVAPLSADGWRYTCYSEAEPRLNKIV